MVTGNVAIKSRKYQDLWTVALQCGGRGRSLRAREDVIPIPGTTKL